MDPFQVSLIQMDVNLGLKEKNLIKAESMIRKAITRVDSKTPHIICLPELFSTGYDLANIDNLAESVPEGKTTKILQKIAYTNAVILVASYIERKGTKYYNTAVVIDENGDFKGKYRKIHLFPLHPLDETKLLTPGNIFIPAFKLSCGTMGVLLCFDLRFPELSRRIALEGNVDFLVYLAEFPRPRDEIWTTLLRARAMENQIFVCGVNRTGKDPSISFFGRSVIYDPLGNYLVEGTEEEEILTAELDLNIIKSVRNILPSFNHRQPDYY